MKIFKRTMLTLVIINIFGTLNTYAEETIGEKTEVVTNNVKRKIKKSAHRISEATCTKGDMKCLGKKVKNHAVELKDATVDGAKDLKNKVD